MVLMVVMFNLLKNQIVMIDSNGDVDDNDDDIDVQPVPVESLGVGQPVEKVGNP